MKWKYEPQAWWPELPGKETPKGWDLTWKPVYDPEKETYRWIGAPTIGGKRLCLECRQVPVRAIQRYCRNCNKSRKRANNRKYWNGKD